VVFAQLHEVDHNFLFAASTEVKRMDSCSL
jgi:hypothetical protein